MPPPIDQPHIVAIAVPIAVATAICTSGPISTMRRTAIRSATEKCRPTPNISRITPMSASWPAIEVVATMSLANRPITTPATR